jgi:hypothetical protein
MFPETAKHLSRMGADPSRVDGCANVRRLQAGLRSVMGYGFEGCHGIEILLCGSISIKPLTVGTEYAHLRL